MSNLEIYVGQYQLNDNIVAVSVVNGELTAVMPGMPPGFEIKVQPLPEAHSFKLLGGPVDGATAVFHFNNKAQATAMVVGNEYELTRMATPTDLNPPSGHGLLPPELLLDEEKTHAFSALMTELLLDGNGREIEWQLPYPKHEFLQYLAMQEEFIFHGSKNMDITEFSTRRTSVELNDRSGRGNKQAVYGTHDGLWPMFFAIVDRQNLSGSIRNGVMYLKNEQGDEQAVYQFSINQELVAKRPYTPGALYVLPRETFSRISIADGSLSNEWASEVPVKPLAKLILEPEDFPFLDQIGGHDDSELLRIGELTKILLERVINYQATNPGFVLKLDWDDEFGAVLLEFITRQRKLMPTVNSTLRFEGDQAVWFEIQGPPAFEQVWADRLAGVEVGSE